MRVRCLGVPTCGEAVAGHISRRGTLDDAICDPAAGTCGFLLAAFDHILHRHGPLDRDQWEHVTHHALRGWEIVEDLRAALAQFQEIADDLALDEAPAEV